MNVETDAAAGSLPNGMSVVVKAVWPEEHGPCHIRTPSYVRGRKGEVVAYLGRYPNPEDQAFKRPAALRRLYQICFALAELWPDEAESPDRVVVELYEHWLEGWKETT